ncbi:MAG: ECF transporter S component [Clostridia bacterium]|nr:ECF transporter S component [Clostridia bacterium]
MKTTTNNSQKVKTLTIIALFCAMSFIVSIIFPIKVMFLTLDFKDTISTICGMFFGPIAGLFCAVVVPFIEFLYSDTGVYGLIMNLLSSVTFVGVSTLIYKYRKTIFGAVIGLVTAACATVAVMLVANLFITPYYMGVTQAAVIELIPKVIFPFNLVKSILNASITMLIYKPISKVLKRMGLSKSTSKSIATSDVEKTNLKTRSLIVTLVSAIVVIVAFIVLFFVLGGKLA